MGAPFENRTRFQTKMGKVDIRLRTNRVEKPYPLGRAVHT